MRPLLRLVSFPVFASILISQAATAYESRFSIPSELNSRARLERLYSTHTTLVSSGSNGNLYWAEASAVFQADAGRMLEAALDYDHYVEFGMPHLHESYLIERASPDLFYTYSSMSYAVMNSSQYMEVRVHRDLGPTGAAGIEWKLTPRRPSWPYFDSPRFGRMDGSFYVEPIDGGRVYVRYFLANQVDLPLGFLFSGAVQQALRSGAGEVISVLAKRAAARP